VARVRRRAFREQTYWGRPVPSFGDPEAKILLVGLAPGAHGSHRTGRMFTGDASGDFLFPALHRSGLASQPTATDKNDGLRLVNCYITSASRCAPPDNKPTRDQLKKCHSFLVDEFDTMPNLKVVVALGGVGLAAVIELLQARGFAFDRKLSKFKHAGEFTARSQDRHLTIVSSYHPSRQNTNTNRLTAEMLDNVFRRAVTLAS
jgi:uracil-DNA glycosylase